MDGGAVVVVVLEGGDIRLSMSMFTPGELHTVGFSGVCGSDGQRESFVTYM